MVRRRLTFTEAAIIVCDMNQLLLPHQNRRDADIPSKIPVYFSRHLSYTLVIEMEHIIREFGDHE